MVKLGALPCRRCIGAGALPARSSPPTLESLLKDTEEAVLLGRALCSERKLQRLAQGGMGAATRLGNMTVLQMRALQ